MGIAPIGPSCIAPLMSLTLDEMKTDHEVDRMQASGV